MKKTEDGWEFFGGKVCVAPPDSDCKDWAVIVHTTVSLIDGQAKTLPGAIIDAFRAFFLSLSVWVEDEVLGKIKK